MKFVRDSRFIEAPVVTQAQTEAATVVTEQESTATRTTTATSTDYSINQVISRDQQLTDIAGIATTTNNFLNRKPKF